MSVPVELDIANGNTLAPDETLVWSGRPSWRRLARGAFHVRGVAAYFVLLFVLDAGQAWRKALPVGQALHDSVPLAVIAVVALLILTGLAILIARTTRYTITDRRVILHYGLALSATLAIPMTQIAAIAVAAEGAGSADIALRLRPGARMPYLKLWPHARAWHVREPQPMLRGVPQGGAVAALLARALQAAERSRVAPPRRVSEPAVAPEPVLALLRA